MKTFEQYNKKELEVGDVYRTIDGSTHVILYDINTYTGVIIFENGGTAPYHIINIDRFEEETDYVSNVIDFIVNNPEMYYEILKHKPGAGSSNEYRNFVLNVLSNPIVLDIKDSLDLGLL